MTEAKEPLSWHRAELPDRLREVVVLLADRLSPQTLRRIEVGLNNDDATGAAEAFAADLTTSLPTVTRTEWAVINHIMIAYRPQELDERRHPHLLRGRAIRSLLPIVSRGDGGARPLTMSEFNNMFERMVAALSDRLDPGAADEIHHCIEYGESGLAFEFLTASLDRYRPTVTDEERAVLRRLVLFYEPDPGSLASELFARGEAIVTALPVIDS